VRFIADIGNKIMIITDKIMDICKRITDICNWNTDICNSAALIILYRVPCISKY